MDNKRENEEEIEAPQGESEEDSAEVKSIIRSNEGAQKEEWL